jgi:hypothetical protein
MSKIKIVCPNGSGMQTSFVVDGKELNGLSRLIQVRIGTDEPNVVTAELVAIHGLDLELPADFQPTFVMYESYDLFCEETTAGVRRFWVRPTVEAASDGENSKGQLTAALCPQCLHVFHLAGTPCSESWCECRR